LTVPVLHFLEETAKDESGREENKKKPENLIKAQINFASNPR